MSSVAKRFVSGRKDPLALTRHRINAILSYIAYCHELEVSEGRRYSRNWVKKNTFDKFENFLKKRLVHDFLKNRKGDYTPYSAIEDILFECEPEMPYTQYDPGTGLEREANDKIDIKVNRLGLQDAWKSIADQDIYLAVECKVLGTLSDNQGYKEDIQKFCDRNYLQFRLPFEAMIAFRESKKTGGASFAENLNRRLEGCKTIRTTQLLELDFLFGTRTLIYSSRHLRNYGRRDKFMVSHLYMDYTEVITE